MHSLRMIFISYNHITHQENPAVDHLIETGESFINHTQSPWAIHSSNTKSIDVNNL